MEVSKAMLAGGYLVAVPLLFRFNRMVRNRNMPMLIALEIGQGLIAVGWVIRDNKRAAIINGAAFIGYPIWYAYKGRTAQSS
ncbi:MAG TPA: hypothetical protein VG266_07210 [Candidatus Dormibacteraeota bacterium]|jgi:hypothetical protein|nr:hypothetical protein [Candidatus Dormibacteraeota bacterium]